MVKCWIRLQRGELESQPTEDSFFKTGCFLAKCQCILSRSSAILVKGFLIKVFAKLARIGVILPKFKKYFPTLE